MNRTIIDRVTDLEELDWDIPGIPDYQDSPEYTLKVVKTFESFHNVDLVGMARQSYIEVLPNYYR